MAAETLSARSPYRSRIQESKNRITPIIRSAQGIKYWGKRHWLVGPSTIMHSRSRRDGTRIFQSSWGSWAKQKRCVFELDRWPGGALRRSPLQTRGIRVARRHKHPRLVRPYRRRLTLCIEIPAFSCSLVGLRVLSAANNDAPADLDMYI